MLRAERSKVHILNKRAIVIGSQVGESVTSDVK